MRITSTLTEGFRFVSDVRGHTVVVDTPSEKGGTDTGPMPPELIAVSLGTCIGIYAVMFCRKHQISTEGLQVHTDWATDTAPERVASLHVTVELPAGIPTAKYEAFMHTVEQCMVHNTLCQRPDITLVLHA